MVAAGDVKYQYVASICANIISFSYGAFCGWPSASFLVLESDESPLTTGPLSAHDAGWISSMLCVGGAFGTIFFAWCADRLGRRRSLMLVAIPALICWLIIPFASTPLHLCLSRFMGGFAGGGTFGVVPLYVTEVAEIKIRGVLGTFMIFSCNIGILVVFTLGYFYSYDIVAWIMAIPSLIFLASFTFLQETPYHLMQKNKVHKAEKALRYFRNIRTAVPELPESLQTELEKLKCEEKSDTETMGSENSLTLQDFTNNTARKALFIGMALMSLNQFCGLFAMMSYMSTIFKVSGSDISPNTASVIIGVIQIFGSYSSTLLVERVGRKLLLTMSAVGVALGLISLGTFMHLSTMGFDLSEFGWVPVASFSFTIFIACGGVLPLPFLVTSEVMPPKIRNIGCMISMLCLWVFAFVLLKLMPFLLQWVGLAGISFFFAGYCLTAAVFVMIVVPETKGRSIEEILSLL